MFYKQNLLNNGLPFEVKLPDHPLDARKMTTGQLDAALEKGYADMQAGRAIPVEKAFAEIREKAAD